jgi:O-antigen ligase
MLASSAMRPEKSPTASNHRFSMDSMLVGMAVLLVLMPWLFISSPDYREVGVRIFGIVAICLAGSMPGLRAASRDGMVRTVLACIFVAYAASLIGGLHHGEPVGKSLLELVTGISGVLGMGMLIWVLLQPRWRPWAWRTFIGLAVVLVVGSLLGFLVFNRWQADLSKVTPHMDTRRLSLVWGTRFLSGDLGRQFWAHANTAAYLFAAAWVVLMDALFRRPRHAWAGWALALLLATAVFLTASRSAWVMVILTLPPLLVFRGWRFSVQVAALLALAGILGFAATNRTTKPPPGGLPAPAGGAPTEIHLGGLVERGSAGRLSAYQILWNDLEGDRFFGQGLAETRQPVAHLLHEHSTYLATLRGGGAIALAAHLVLIGCAFSAALLLARGGCRWPLLLAVAVFSGLLFDRSTVFRLTGFDEFPTHWLAVWIPLAMLIQQSGQPLIASCRPTRPDKADSHPRKQVDPN